MTIRSATIQCRALARAGRTLLLVLGATALAVPAWSQCPGDCDGSQAVTVNELVTGVNIALDQADIDACPAFDTDGSDTVTVNELIAAVNVALSECPAVSSPTPTMPQVPTLTATPQGTPTPTATVGSPTVTPTVTETAAPGTCGDGVTDFANGETCDDGNRDEGPGDSCPADCQIVNCAASDTTIDVDVSFSVDTGTDLAAVQTFVTYDDERVRIPGRGQAQSVLDRFSNLIEGAVSPAYNFNDQDYSLSVLAFTSGEVIPPGRLFTVTFDVCEGATPPVAADFTCRVTDPAEGAACEVTIP
jgi:hypothetical protein